MLPQLVIFDIAGTTVLDPDGVGGCLKQALAAAGVHPGNASVVAVMGIPKPLAIRSLLSQAGETPDEGRIDNIHRDFQDRMIEYYRTDPDVREVPGALEVFRVLRARGVKVALDTGFDRSIVDTLLQRLEWADEVDATAASDEVERGRPHPDLVFYLMDRLGVKDAAQVVKVGDTPSDLQEGTAAGCALVIGVTSGAHTEEALAAFPHTHIVESVRDVPSLLMAGAQA